MDKYECHKTEKWNSENTEIIHIYGRTRIGCCTSERVIYEVTTDDLWLLEDVVKEFEKYTRDRNEIHIPEDRASFRKSIGYHERQYRKHHDSCPPAELTWIESISTIKPSTRDVLVSRISEIWEIKRTCNGKHRLDNNTRDKPVMIPPKSTIERKYLKEIVNHEKTHYDILDRDIKAITKVNCAKKEDKKWYPVRENSFHTYEYSYLYHKISIFTWKNKK